MGGHSAFGNPVTQVPENPKAERRTPVIVFDARNLRLPRRLSLALLSGT